MRFIDYALWNPFALLKARAPASTLQADGTSDNLPTQEETEMADNSDFDISSAILAAALVEKSELKGKELEVYALNMQRWLLRQMITFREKIESEQS